VVRDKVVKDDHTAGPERGDQDLLTVGAERGVSIGPSNTAGAVISVVRSAAPRRSPKLTHFCSRALTHPETTI